MIKYLAKSAARFVGQLQTYAANPADHAREIVLLAGVFFVLLFLVFDLYLYFGAWRRVRRLPKAPSIPVRRPFNWKIPVIVTLVTTAIILSAGAVAPTQTSFCPRCHSMRPAYKSWRASSHKKIGCMGCHQEPGVIGFVTSRTAGLRNLSVRTTYAGRFRPTRLLRLPNSACLKCHGEIIAKTLTVKAIRVSHREFAQEISCAACHAEVGHRRVRAKASPATTEKRYCMNCHNGGVAGRDCGTCHVGDIGGAPRPGANTITTVNLPLECDGCHSQEGCLRCHTPKRSPRDRDDDM